MTHEDCQLCHAARGYRQERIADLRRTIELLDDEIDEIGRGMRHTAFHESQLAALSRRCEVCHAKPGDECVSTIRLAAPLHGRTHHLARTIERAGKETRNDAC